jgi:hypothetical protein
MKKIFTLAALLFSLISFAAAPPKATKIVVNNFDNAIVQVRIDGTMYNVTDNSFVLKNIVPGRHKIEVFKMERKSRMFRPRAELIYKSTVMIEPSAVLDININRFGNVSVTKKIDDRFDGNGRRNNKRW